MTRVRTPSGQSIKLAILATGIMACVGGRIILPALLPAIIDDLGITASQAGYALSLSWGLFALMHYPGGVSADQLTPKTTILAGLATLAVGSVALLVAAELVGLLVGVALIGVGAGLYLPATYALSSELFPENVGTAFGVLSSSINVGGAIVPAIAIVAVSALTWQSAFYPLLAVYLLTIALSHRSFDGAYVVSGIDLDMRATLSRLLRSARTRWTLVAIASLSFAWQGFTSFLPLFLQTEKGVSPTTATALYTSVYVVGILVNPFSGRLSDRLGRRTMLVVQVSIAAVGLGILVTAQTFGVVAAGVVVSAVGLTGVWPVVNAHVIGLFPDSSYAGDFGASRMIFLGIGSLGPSAVGYVGSATAYVTAYAVLILCLCVTLAAIVLKLE